MAREDRLNRFPKNYFNVIIVDEAHHSIADSYQRILNYFENTRVLGVTATPDRGDMRDLGDYYKSIAYEYTLSQAIDEGYLSPIVVETIPLKLDLSKVKMQTGDFSASELGDVLEPFLEAIADEMVKACMNRKTVVFLPLVSTSQLFKKILNERGFKAAEINGKSSDRAEILEAYANGEYNVICNAMLLTGGWDCPSVDCVVVLRPTKIRSLYSQMVGRGTRLFEGKENLLLLDFLWHTTRHKLCHPASLISENEDIEKRITDIIANSEEPIDLKEALSQAEDDIEKEREEKLARELRDKIGLSREKFDPIKYELALSMAKIENEYQPIFQWEREAPTTKQVEVLEDMGIKNIDITNKGKASKLLNLLLERQKNGLSSLKQVRCLEDFGFIGVGSWSKKEANMMIDIIAKNGWEVPSGIDPQSYVQQYA